MTSIFLPSLLFEIFSNLSQVQLKNIDFWRYPELEPKGLARVKAWGMDQCLAVANRFLLSHMAHFPSGHATTTLLGILNRLPDYERTHDSFDSEYSRQVMIKVLAFRVLSNRYMKLPQNNAEFWKLRRRLEAGELLDRSVGPLQVGGLALPRYDLRPLGYPMRLRAHPLNILNTFMLKQYDSRVPEVSVHVLPGDIVIDGGACWGDTSLYYACLCGEAGKVFAFEILPENLAIMEQNITDNPELGGRIECVKRALWNRSGETLGYTSRASGTSLLVGSKDDGSVETISIDDWVRQRALPRVDFIKLDVEGAELDALRGAEKTIRTFRPRIAVSVYHREDDLISIPAFLHSFNCGYKLLLDHFTIYNEETILFADPKVATATSERAEC
jgi:FkbM family methyltransferase